MSIVVNSFKNIKYQILEFTIRLSNIFSTAIFFLYSKTTGRILEIMARPRKSEHIKEQLLEQGIELLIEHGYHGTGLKKILDEVNVPKGSFYNFFASKEQFVSEVIERYSQYSLTQLDQYIEDNFDDPVACIKNIHYYLIDMHKKNGLQGCLIGNLSAEIATSSKTCQMTMKHAHEEWEKRFTKLIGEAQRQGLIRRDLSAEILSNILWSTWQGGLLEMKIKDDTEPLKEILEATIDVLFK